MFSILITIIAIVLVVVLALATLYYGAQYVNNGTVRASVAKAVQEGNQVVGAFELYKASNSTLPSGTDAEIKAALVSEDYLRGWPADAWEFRDNYAVRMDLNNDLCLALNMQYGIDTVPQCSDTAFEGRTVCCSSSS